MGPAIFFLLLVAMGFIGASMLMVVAGYIITKEVETQGKEVEK